MNRSRNDADQKATTLPVASPEPGCNPGYAEDRPKDKAQAQIPGARPEPDAEAGGLEHEPDPET